MLLQGSDLTVSRINKPQQRAVNKSVDTTTFKMSLSSERNSVTLKTTPTPTYDLTQFNTQQTINGATPATTARKRTNQFMFAAALAKRSFVLKYLFLRSEGTI
jgi:hypothetical protein